MQNTELYIDVLINGETHRINISHNEHVCDAEIQVDSKSVETKSKIIMNGGVLTFYIDGHESRLLILKKGSEYEYDCFLDGVSVQSGMPWKLAGCELPEVLKWKENRLSSLGKYCLTEGLKGAILGCFLFFLIFIGQYFIPQLNGKVGFVYLLISLAVPCMIFVILAPSEYKKKEAALEEYKKYLQNS